MSIFKSVFFFFFSFPSNIEIESINIIRKYFFYSENKYKVILMKQPSVKVKKCLKKIFLLDEHCRRGQFFSIKVRLMAMVMTVVTFVLFLFAFFAPLACFFYVWAWPCNWADKYTQCFLFWLPNVCWRDILEFVVRLEFL